MNQEPLENLVFLTQTDTTIGFVSQNSDKLNRIKRRLPDKHYIKALSSLHQLTSFVRVPDKHKNRIRRAKRTTFVFPDGNSYRVIKENHHTSLLLKLGWAYTTSANLSGEVFNQSFAESAADVIIKFPIKNDNQRASQIVKINHTTIKRIR